MAPPSTAIATVRSCKLSAIQGLSRLVAAGVHLPRQCDGDLQRVALEGYPGWLAFELIGRRSYKNSDASDRRDALLCLAQAAWARLQPDGGLLSIVDAVEGWILGAGQTAAGR